MQQPYREQRNSFIHWLVLFTGLGLSFLAFRVAVELENRTIQVEHESATQLAIDALSKELEINQSRLSGIQRFFMVSPEVSREDFFRFTESLIRDNASIHAMEWVPQVMASERETYRLNALADGLTDFEFRSQNAEGKLIPTQDHWVYYPVFYVEPLARNMAVLGFDLATSPERMASLQMARLSRQTQATSSITLIQASARQKGFLIIQPIFVPLEKNQTLSQERFNGYVLGVFRVGDLFKSAIQPLKALLDPLMIKIIDITDLADTELLYSMKSSAQLEPLPGWRWRYARDIQIANRTWRITSIATTQFAQLHSKQTEWLVLAVGITFTLLISFYLRNLINREVVIKKLVNQRSRQLVESEKMNRTIVENAVDAVITINPLGIVSLFSPAAEKMFGYSAEEVIGQNIKILMPEPYHSEHDGYLDHYQQTHEKRIIGIGREVVGKRKSGLTFPMNLSVGQAQVNGGTLFIGTVKDLTDMKQQENELKEFNDRLELAARAGSIGVWDFDVIQNTLNWDKRMFDLYGLTKDQFPDAYEAWQGALHPDDLLRTKAELNDAIQNGKSFETEFRILWPNHEERHIKASALVVLDDQKRAQRMIGVNLDITEQKRSEQAMLRAKLAAEDANRQKSAFLNVMSHELRTPLTVILGYLPMLKNLEQMPSAEIIAQIANDMDISGNHLLEMINDLLDISKIEAGQMDLQLETIHSLPLIQEMIRKFENLAERKSIELMTDAQDFEFQVDARRLRQILINLLGNALKFTRQGSIKISAVQQDKRVTFSVADTGIGIPQKELPFIFDTFHQVDDSSTRNVGGSGLGLAITKRLVELHGGNIQVESIYGSGTTFSFTLKQE
ncbi:MAG: CHASE domain-containing protein [Gammaproteobacteria bacterium]|nr:CHASE domain-containing protein [Gammaproteobacteria bacterium]